MRAARCRCTAAAGGRDPVTASAARHSTSLIGIITDCASRMSFTAASASGRARPRRVDDDERQLEVGRQWRRDYERGYENAAAGDRASTAGAAVVPRLTLRPTR